MTLNRKSRCGLILSCLMPFDTTNGLKIPLLWTPFENMRTSDLTNDRHYQIIPSQGTGNVCLLFVNSRGRCSRQKFEMHHIQRTTFTREPLTSTLTKIITNRLIQGSQRLYRVIALQEVQHSCTKKRIRLINLVPFTPTPSRKNTSTYCTNMCFVTRLNQYQQDCAIVFLNSFLAYLVPNTLTSLLDSCLHLQVLSMFLENIFGKPRSS